MNNKIQSTSKFYLDPGKLNILKEIVGTRWEEIIEDLGVNLKFDGAGWRGTCPVHGGDNNTAILLYTSGHTSPGFWKCYTKGCEKEFTSTLIGFIRGVLSSKKKGKVTLYDAVQWICSRLKIKFDNITPDNTSIEKYQFSSALRIIKPNIQANDIIPKEEFLKKLRMPSRYFCAREFREETLRHFYVGDANSGTERLSGRAIVPILNENEDALGFSGRSVFEKCSKCNSYHDPNRPCPQSNYQHLYSKWIHSKGFNAESILYNWPILRAKKRPKAVIVVEGPPDVWRLHEAGIENAVAIFKNDISDNQQILLETGGVLGLIIGLDNDGPGQEGAKCIEEKLERSFYIERWIPPGKDAADSPIELIQSSLIPILDRMEKKI